MPVAMKINSLIYIQGLKSMQRIIICARVNQPLNTILIDILFLTHVRGGGSSLETAKSWFTFESVLFNTRNCLMSNKLAYVMVMSVSKMEAVKLKELDFKWLASGLR